MPKLSLAKLERHLYGAADILRQKGMDASTCIEMQMASIHSEPAKLASLKSGLQDDLLNGRASVSETIMEGTGRE